MVVTETGAAYATGASLGVFTLLAGWLGFAAADVGMVFFYGLGGCYVAQMEVKDAAEAWGQTIKWMIAGVIMCMVFSWLAAGLIVKFYPDAESVYLPSTISFLIGVVSRRVPRIINAALGKGEKKIGLEEAAK